MSVGKILIIDDDRSILKSLDRYFRRKDYETHLADNDKRALHLFSTHKPSLVITDINLPQSNGLDLVKKMKQSDRNLAAIFMTGSPTQEFILRCLKLGAADFLPKPINCSQLEKSIERVLVQQKKKAQAKAQEQTLTRLVEVQDQELKQTQQALSQSSKMSALGELAAGIAHEINQPLTALKLTAQEALFTLDADKLDFVQLKDCLGDMQRQIDLMSGIVRYMRTFSRTSEEERYETVDGNHLLTDVLALATHQFRSRGILVETQLSHDLPTIYCTPVKLQQVFMNLLSNARDALDDVKKSPKRILVGSSFQKTRFGQEEIVFTVEDNANGIPPSIQNKIFMPLFTTKGRTQGTGLGLSISKKIVESLGGRLDFETEDGVGTCFRLTVPVNKAQDVHSIQKAA